MRQFSTHRNGKVQKIRARTCSLNMRKLNRTGNPPARKQTVANSRYEGVKAARQGSRIGTVAAKTNVDRNRSVVAKGKCRVTLTGKVELTKPYEVDHVQVAWIHPNAKREELNRLQIVIARFHFA